MRRRQAGGRRGRRPGWVRATGWLLLLLGSLLLVTWRQTRGLEMERALRALQGETALAETERVELARRIEELRSRSRIVREARERLRMHLPEEGEIVFLRVDPAAPAAAPLGAGGGR